MNEHHHHECCTLDECKLNKTYKLCQSNWTGKCPNGCETIRKEGLRREILEHLFFMGFGINAKFHVVTSHMSGVVIKTIDPFTNSKVAITGVEAKKLYAEAV